MRILRHETGHAIENAYRLRRRRRRQQLFGKSSQPYPQYYAPQPYSKRFVLHLEAWYAQSHPDEDFAETFAVWLTPSSSWRRRYAGWPALQEARVRRRADATSSPARRRRSRTRRVVDPLAHAAQDAARALRARSARATARQPARVRRPRPAPSVLRRRRRSRAIPTAASFLRRVRAAAPPQRRELDRRATSTRSTRCSTT